MCVKNHQDVVWTVQFFGGAMILGKCNGKCNWITRKHYIPSVVATKVMNLRPSWWSKICGRKSSFLNYTPGWISTFGPLKRNMAKRVCVPVACPFAPVKRPARRSSTNCNMSGRILAACHKQCGSHGHSNEMVVRMLALSMAFCLRAKKLPL